MFEARRAEFASRAPGDRAPQGSPKGPCIEADGPLLHARRVPRQRQQRPKAKPKPKAKAKKKNPAEAGLSEGENRLPASSLYNNADQASPHTSCAVSITRRSLVRWASTAMLLPWTVLEKPHCGERASCSSGAYFAASAMRRLRSSLLSN